MLLQAFSIDRTLVGRLSKIFMADPSAKDPDNSIYQGSHFKGGFYISCAVNWGKCSDFEGIY